MNTEASVSNVSANLSIRKGSNRMCCVVGCFNSERKNPELQFYRFPGFTWEVDRKNKWIAAVRRQTIDKKPWVPTKNTRICSIHFVGGEKSNDPRKISYNPTLFPEMYKNKKSDSKRAKRLEARLKHQEKSKKKRDEALSQMETDMETSIGSNFSALKNCEIGVQTDPDFEEICQDEPNFSFCSTDGNNASTQTVVKVNNSSKQREAVKVIVEPLQREPVKTRTTAVGPDCEMRGGFMGFSNIETDESMKQFGGIDLNFFRILLKFISPKTDGQPAHFKKLSAHNRLLLFLIKMKHGLPYTMLGSLFDVSRTTATRVFQSVLQTLISQIKSWLFWPSREAIKETMPPTFVNYPNCRAIIDCTELRCDTPPTIEQRILMYSQYKSSFTVKFLIAISPSGLITFVSKAYGGKATDGFITNDSGFLNFLEPGDQIMADKGFPQIRSELLQRQCTLVMPPFAFNPQFTREEVLEGHSIASVRIHVERAIQRVKIFKILNHVNIDLLPYIDDVIVMACILANNKEPIFK